MEPGDRHSSLNLPVRTNKRARQSDDQRARKWAVGVRHTLFPMPTLGASSREGCRLPDAIFHGKRNFRPRSRAVAGVAAARFRVRLFSSLRLVVAPPACEPGQDTPVTFMVASSPLSARSATDFVRAFTSCHGSRLFTLRLHSSHSPAVFFSTSPALRKVSCALPGLSCPSRRVCSLCPGFRRLSFG